MTSSKAIMWLITLTRIFTILLFIRCICVNSVQFDCYDEFGGGNNEVEDTIEGNFCTIGTKNGRIRGKQNRTIIDKKPFYSFLGIPFAKPPIGNLRFKVS